MTQHIEDDPRIRALADAAERGARYLRTQDRRAVAPAAPAVSSLARLRERLPEEPCDPLEVLRLLDDCASPATVVSAGRRYFGFVTGGTLPAALGATVLAAVWDQNAALEVMSPAAAAVEETAAEWVIALLGLPPESAVGFATGATMANLAALAAARGHVLAKSGWDLAEQGLLGAPRVTVVGGDEVHVTVLKALTLLGFGRSHVVRVPVDDQGRMRPDAFPAIQEPSIVCLQAGNVNTGAFDPLTELCQRAHAAGAWVHVDGAFGLWALASPALAGIAEGSSLADSWATDAHKWLNVPYDSGLAIVRDPTALRTAMALRASYLAEGRSRDGAAFVPEFSRRTRGVEVWAAVRSLGRRGLQDLLERCCRLARRFAEGIRSAGYDVLNDVVLNQVLVSFGSAERTTRVVEALQADGTCWCGTTIWQGRTAMRLSVSSWCTTERDVDRSLEAVLRIARSIG